jgi:hypothetical protein
MSKPFNFEAAMKEPAQRQWSESARLYLKALDVPHNAAWPRVYACGCRFGDGSTWAGVPCEAHAKAIGPVPE